MALRGTLTHRKTRRLARLLHISQAFALGILESLWHVTAEQQPDGGIGRMKDIDIAEECFYDGDAAALISALWDAGWLDKSEECRYYVHDWHDHADDSVQSKMIQWTRLFANGVPPRLTKLTKDARERVIQRYETRFGSLIGEKMRCVRTNSNRAHDAHGAHGAHIQSPEPESRVQSQSPETNERAPESRLPSHEPESQGASVRPSSPPIEIPLKPMPALGRRDYGDKPADIKRIEEMRNALHDCMRFPTRDGPERPCARPDEAIVLRCLIAVRETPIAHVREYLADLVKARKLPPNGPDSPAWFEPVLAAHFGPGGKVAQIHSAIDRLNGSPMRENMRT